MSHQSLHIATNIITHLLEKTWLGVAQHNIHRMMPINVRLMNVYTFQSLAQLSSNQLQASDSVAGIGDQGSLGRDNLLGSFIKVEKSSKCVTQGTEIMSNNSMLSTGKARFKINKSGSKNSNQTSKIATQRNKQQNSQFKILEVQGDDELLRTVTSGSKIQGDDMTRNIDLMRERIIVAQQLNKKEMQELKIKEMAKLEKQDILRKKKKQIDKFTYDYDGDFFGSKVPNPESTLGAAAKIKPQLELQGGKNSKKIQKKKPLFTTIINEKLQERYKRIATLQQQAEKNQDMFKQTLAARFANSFSHDDDISEGISIKQTTSNFSRMKPLNRIGQKLTLSQFKREITNKKFKQFHMRPLRNTNHINKVLKPKLVSHKSQQNFLENKNSQLASQLYNISQKPKRYKTMLRSQQSSLLNQSQLSRKSQHSGLGIASNLKKGKIKISNPSLYDSILKADEQEESYGFA